MRPFRFAASVRKAGSLDGWVALAHHVEQLGYSTLQMPDHFGKQFAVGPALGAIAATTRDLRLGCAVYANDYYHPIQLAREATTIDLLSGGRLEFGIGAGWNKEEYDAIGKEFESPAVRVSRMTEAVELLIRLWTEDVVTHRGEHYRLSGFDVHPRPTQKPHPPIMIGGAGRRMLTFAGRHAQIVGFVQPALPEGGLDFGVDTLDDLARKVAWVNEAAPGREEQPELHALMWDVEVSATATRDPSPHHLRGSLTSIADTLLELRERLGISYISVLQKDMETFAPVIEKLRDR